MINLKKLLSLLLLSTSIPSICFNTLTDLQEYADQHAEFPNADDDYWADPDYTSYHRKLNPTVLTQTLQAIGLQKNTGWDITYFEDILNRTLAQRKKAGLSGRKVAHIQFTFPAKVLVWGDLGGCFHSLVRSLNWLQSQGIINDHLEVTKNGYYLVFNGNVINRSPYILETLTTLMILLERNPDRVIYIRGEAEDRQNWHDEGLKRELLIRSNRRLTGKIPYDEPVSDFFETLPLAFYISTIKDPATLIRISPSGLNNAEIDEQLCNDFWTTLPKDALHYYDITKRIPSASKVDVRVIIKSEDWMIERRSVSGEPRNMFGLGLLDQDRSATAWSILSAPNMGNQKYFGFEYDAFVQLSIEAYIKDSSICLFNENIKLLQGFKQHEGFNLFTGIQLTRKNIVKNDFKIGSSLGLIGGLPVMSRNVLRGMSNRIQKANLQDELHSLYLTLTTYNDDYTPYVARENIVKLIDKDHVDVVLSPTGHQTLTSYLDLIRENKLLVLFPIAGSSEFFKPDLAGLINYRAQISDEIYALISHIIAKKAVKRVALFYQEDAYGLSALDAAHRTLKSFGVTDWIDISYLRGSTEFKKQADIIKEKNPDSIGLLSTALPTREFLRQLGTQNLTNKVLFGPSFLAEDTIRTFAARQGVSIVFSAIIPSPFQSTSPLVEEYRKQMSIYGYKYDTFSLEGYLGASILIDALSHIKEPTREKIKSYLESLKNYDLKGIKLSFDPEKRSLSTKVWIEQGENEPWIEFDLVDLRAKIKQQTDNIQEIKTTIASPINTAQNPQKP
jgi:ABC-type branched-subunit amino acid transport system substrate-binding protein